MLIVLAKVNSAKVQWSLQEILICSGLVSFRGHFSGDIAALYTGSLYFIRNNDGVTESEWHYDPNI